MKCSNCGNELPVNSVFCDNCGCKIEMHVQQIQKVHCGNCGSEMDEGVEFCGNCGTSIRAGVQAETRNTFCGNCGSAIENGTEFCGNCGMGVTNNAASVLKVPKKKKSILPVIIVILIIIIALLVGLFATYIFYFLNKEDNSVTDSNISISERVGKSATSDDNESVSTSPQNEDGIKTNAMSTPQPQAPVFTYVTASSIRGTDTEGGQYSAEAVLDSDKMTKWVPAKESNGGISEWIQINSSDEQCINGILILNGYHKSEEIWKNNNRVKSCTLSFSDGQSKTVTLDDTMDMIRIDLDTPVNTTYIRLTINSIYSGSKWDDTAVTYLSAF